MQWPPTIYVVWWINCGYALKTLVFRQTRTSNFNKVVRQHTVGVGKYNMDFVENLLRFPAVKELWKSVKNWKRYRHEFGVLIFDLLGHSVSAAKVMLLMNNLTTFLSCCWSNTLCSSHFYYDLRQSNSCAWFSVTNLVFNVTICHFKWVSSDCVGKAGLRFKCGSVGRSDFKCCEWVILPGHFLAKSLWV